MNWQTAHDDSTQSATLKELKDYLTELASTNDPHILDAGIHREAAKLYRHLIAALNDLDGIRDALARIDRNNDGDGE